MPPSARLAAVLVAALLSLPAVAAPPTPARSAVFKDWMIGCDTALTCSAVSLPEPETGGGPDGGRTVLSLTRDAGPAGRASLALGLDGPVPSQPIEFRVDGKPVLTLSPARLGMTRKDDDLARGALRDDGAIAILVGATLAGQVLSLRAGGQDIAAISLAGLSAALRFMDDRQHRDNTVTALVAKGSRPESTVPSPPSLPVVHRAPQPAALGEAEVGRLADLVRRRLPKDGGPDECTGLDNDQSPDSFTADGFALSASLAVINLRCSISGAYNLITGLYGVDRRSGEARPIVIAVADGTEPLEQAETGVPVVTSSGFDAKTMTLSTYERGRGPGDCGAYAEFVWDGTRFAASLYRAMPTCRGVTSDDWPTTYRAAVR